MFSLFIIRIWLFKNFEFNVVCYRTRNVAMFL